MRVARRREAERPRLGVVWLLFSFEEVELANVIVAWTAVRDWIITSIAHARLAPPTTIPRRSPGMKKLVKGVWSRSESGR